MSEPPTRLTIVNNCFLPISLSSARLFETTQHFAYTDTDYTDNCMSPSRTYDSSKEDGAGDRCGRPRPPQRRRKQTGCEREAPGCVIWTPSWSFWSEI
jgi:hypothetical protein